MPIFFFGLKIKIVSIFIQKNKLSFPKSKKDYVYVGIQIILFVSYVLPVQLFELYLPEWLRFSGLVTVSLGSIFGALAILQLNKRLSPFPTPVAHAKLITNGVYAIARHPIYTSIIIVTFGYALFRVSFYKAVISVALLVLLYFKSKYEETLLAQKFEAYTYYKQKTRRFI
jgi:protein-S-isoprenylcysteine O-methyltransferase Ste14